MKFYITNGDIKKIFKDKISIHNLNLQVPFPEKLNVFNFKKQSVNIQKFKNK